MEKNGKNGSSIEKNGKNGSSLNSNSAIDDKLGHLVFDLVDTIHTMGIPSQEEPQANKPK